MMDLIPMLVKKNRTLRGLSIERLAEKAKISKTILVRIENNQSNPQWGTLQKLLSALEIPLWKAMMIEEMTEVIPALETAVVGRLRSGLWRIEPGQPEQKGNIEVKVADYILRAIDQELEGRLLEQARLSERAHANGWTARQLAVMAEAISREFVPEDSEDLQSALRSMSALKQRALVQEKK